MDNGSQIISMDTRIATGLHLHWDPDVRVHMQSANGTLNSTRGLARNVPFTFGDITIFMQVHIMDDVPYDVLIGRPFDVLCETEIKNAKNGDQFITITDPNTGRKVTIPTYPRGERPSIKPRPIEKLVDEGNGGNQEDSSESSEDEDDFLHPSNDHNADEFADYNPRKRRRTAALGVGTDCRPPKAVQRSIVFLGPRRRTLYCSPRPSFCFQ